MSTLIVRRIDAWGAAAISAGMALIVHDAVAPRTTGLLASIALLYWLGYFLNDYFDAPFDACDEAKAKSSFFVIHAVAPRLFALVVAAVSLSLLVAFAQFGPRGVADRSFLTHGCLDTPWTPGGQVGGGGHWERGGRQVEMASRKGTR